MRWENFLLILFSFYLCFVHPGCECKKSKTKDSDSDKPTIIPMGPTMMGGMGGMGMGGMGPMGGMGAMGPMGMMANPFMANPMMSNPMGMMAAASMMGNGMGFSGMNPMMTYPMAMSGSMATPNYMASNPYAMNAANPMMMNPMMSASMMGFTPMGIPTMNTAYGQSGGLNNYDSMALPSMSPFGYSSPTGGQINEEMHLKVQFQMQLETLPLFKVRRVEKCEVFRIHNYLMDNFLVININKAVNAIVTDCCELIVE